MAKIQLRRGTAAQWTAAETLLGSGEVGVETDTLKVKVGDGTTPWSLLGYVVGADSSSVVAVDNGDDTIDLTVDSDGPFTLPTSAGVDARIAAAGATDGRRVVADPIGTGGADTGPIADVIAAAKSAGGRQCVQLRPGVYSVDPNELALDFDDVLFTGFGNGVTQVEKTGNGDLLTITSETNDAGVVQRAMVKDLRLDGNSFTGTLIKSMYGSQCHIKGVEAAFNNGPGIDLIRAWDTSLDEVFLDWCGATDGTTPALRLRNSGAASGVGFSSGQTNMIYTRNLRIESFRNALGITRGTGSAGDPYGIYFSDVKLETYYSRAATLIDVVNVRGVSMRDFDISILGKEVGAPSPVIMNWAPLWRSKLDGLRFNNGASVVDYGIDSWIPGSGSHEITNVTFEGAAAASFHVYHNTANDVDMRGVTAAAGTLHGGSLPPGVDGTVRKNTQTANYTLVAADRTSVVEINKATAATLTVPPNSSVPFAIGTIIEVQQYGAGQVTLTPGSGVTIRTASSLTTRAQYSTVSLRKRGTDEWVASGDLT